MESAEGVIDGKAAGGLMLLWLLIGPGLSSPLPGIADGCVSGTELIHTATAWRDS